LIVWQKSMKFVVEIYRVTQDFTKDEIYGITSQLRRAAVSVASNIAEGQGRISKGELKQSLGQARGSLLEVETQLSIARSLGYLSESQEQKLLISSAEAGRMLNGLLGWAKR